MDLPLIIAILALLAWTLLPQLDRYADSEATAESKRSYLSRLARWSTIRSTSPCGAPGRVPARTSSRALHTSALFLFPGSLAKTGAPMLTVVMVDAAPGD